FSRSYGTILPSSLTRVLPIALVFSTCPPVSVLVRARPFSLDAFLGGMASGTSPMRARHPVSALMGDGFPYHPAYPVPPSVKQTVRGTGISTCCPSPTPFGLGLGPD